jgi:hypothetical protein
MPYIPQSSACLPRAGSLLGFWGNWASLGLALSSVLVINPVTQAEMLSGWQFAPDTQQLTLTLPAGVTPQYAVEPNPTRIVLVLPQTQLGSAPAAQTYSGAVRQVSLSHLNDSTVFTLELAPGVTLAEQGAHLVAIPAGDQTRWVLTALAMQPPTVSPQNALSRSPLAAPTHPPQANPQMIVELPVLPGGDAQFGFPAPGTGRLSTSAGNLMLPSDIDNLTNLPETLPIDPFNLGLSGEQVSVPSLAELDAVVGPVATVPVPAVPIPAVAPPATAIAPAATLGNGSQPSAFTLEPPPLLPSSVATVSIPPTEAAVAIPPTLAPIDSETSGVPIAVTPPISPGSDEPSLERSVTVESPVAAPVPAVDNSPSEAIAIDPPAMPMAVLENTGPSVVIEPPPLPSAAAAIAPPPSPVAQEPPPIATMPVVVTGTDPNLLTVPMAPNATNSGDPIPPTPPLVLAAAGEPILFGVPLPGDRPQRSFPEVVPASPLSPDILVAAGTLLQLRYVGQEPLDLNTSSNQNHVLLLAQDIRDPITRGIVAPAGSQLIGQFESTPQGQRWISKMLIAPAGQQVPFASTSDYIVGTADLTSPRLAAGAGLGALALMLVTGFSGVGLLGGALVGATTALGTAPQTIVIEPNQIIQVQVIQDIPRSIPIASAPETSREWGGSGW